MSSLSGLPRVVAAAIGLALVVGGCTGPREVQVPVSAGSARLASGETLRVDLGAVNESVGDSWYLVQPPDAAVLGSGARHYDSDCDRPGCGGRLTWTFAAAGTGTTTVVFRYCYRSRPENCQPQPDRGPTDPVLLTVVVG